MRESIYQGKLIKKLKQRFPGCVVTKQDPTHIQGIPDLVIFHRDRWAMLEVKASKEAEVQPNQTHYVGSFDDMSFAAFIYPENEAEVLDALQQAFGV